MQQKQELPFAKDIVNPQSDLAKRMSFFANGAEVDHGDHVHVFQPHEDHVDVQFGVAVPFVEETESGFEFGLELLLASKCVSKEEAYAAYLSVVSEAANLEASNDSEESETYSSDEEFSASLSM